LHGELKLILFISFSHNDSYDNLREGRVFEKIQVEDGSGMLQLFVLTEETQDEESLSVYQTNLFDILQLLKQLLVIYQQQVEPGTGARRAHIQERYLPSIPNESYLNMKCK
jgi:hypothetical protein